MSAGNGESGNNSNENSGGDGKRGSNKGSNSGSGNDTDPCDKDGIGTSKDPTNAAPLQRCFLYPFHSALSRYPKAMQGSVCAPCYKVLARCYK